MSSAGPESAVVTGLGAVCPLGLDLATVAAGLSDGRAAGALTVPDFDPRAHFRQPKSLKLVDRRGVLAVVAASAALSDAALSAAAAGLDRESLGVLLGTSGADLRVDELVSALAGDRDGRAASDTSVFAERILGGLNPLWILLTLPNMPSGHVAMQCAAQGPNSTRMSGWLAGLEALGEAARMVRLGECPAALAGATDSGLGAEIVAAHRQAGLATAAADRFGEGAAVVLLEAASAAAARGARVYGSVAGFGIAIAIAMADTDASMRAIAAAVAEAGWPADVACLPTAPFEVRLGQPLAAGPALVAALVLGGFVPPPRGRRVVLLATDPLGAAAALALELPATAGG